MKDHKNNKLVTELLHTESWNVCSCFYKGQSESNASCLLSLRSIYGISHYISEVLEHSQSYSTNFNSFIRQMAAPELILKWQSLTSRWYKKQLVAVGEKPTYIHKHLLRVYCEGTVD
jgi:hypothetical protein